MHVFLFEKMLCCVTHDGTLALETGLSLMMSWLLYSLPALPHLGPYQGDFGHAGAYSSPHPCMCACVRTLRCKEHGER